MSGLLIGLMIMCVGCFMSDVECSEAELEFLRMRIHGLISCKRCGCEFHPRLDEHYCNVCKEECDEGKE